MVAAGPPAGRLRPTHRQAASRRYLQPGGAWDVPSLPALPGPAVIGDGVHRISGADMAGQAARLAGGLRAAGVRRGNAVAWQLPNRLEAVALFHACWRIGAMAVPIHHLLGPAEVDRMLAITHPALCLAAPDLPLADHRGTLLVERESHAWESLVSGRPWAGQARGSDVAVALFTSGSSGEPKAVLHSHRALAHKARAMVIAHGLGSQDAVLMPAPLAHISGLLSGVLIPAAAGMRVTLMERWDAGRAVAIVADQAITFMIGPPTYFSTMADASGFSRAAVRSLATISCGSMPVTPEFVAATAESFGASVKRTYGSTEAPTVTTAWAGDPAERARETDGRVAGQAELRVVDPDSGRRRPPGQVGELLLRGPELFCGYADPAQTADVMHRGWFRTGDLATVDGDGWLTIVGRRKELIIRGGENIVPAEVERSLEAHPDIVQAVVVGLPDERLGERVAACVTTRAAFDLQACRAWCAGRGLARFKTPERVLVVTEIPTRSLGKPDRDAVAALFSRPGL
jgi:acyl-CoA synthetase (AMP-forming)/AMP-acid ligase II